MSDMDEAVSLATALWRRHYREEAPQWEPLDTVAGVISQIDNMTAGMIQDIEDLTAERDDLRRTLKYREDQDEAMRDLLMERDALKTLRNEVCSVLSEGRGCRFDGMADRVREIQAERDALKAFRMNVVGWREYDHPEWFDRRTADYIADLGRETEPPQEKSE